MNEEPKPVEYNGKTITPGHIHDFVSKKDYPMVDEHADHYVILNDGAPRRLPKDHENKFFKVHSKHKVIGDPSRQVNEGDLLFKNNVKQKSLVVGTDFEGAEKTHTNSGAHGDEGYKKPFFTTNAKGKRIFVKPADAKVDKGILATQEHTNPEFYFPQYHREVAYHNAMHDALGLGEHVPTTTSFKLPGTEEVYTAQEARDGGHAFSGESRRTLKDLHTAGTTQKLAIADWLLGNQDRHAGNYLIERNPSRIHLIDHGATFQYDWYHDHPDYIRQAGAEDEKFDQATRNWVDTIKPEKLEKSLRESGVPEHHIRYALGRLERLQDATYTGEPISHAWLADPKLRQRL